MLKRGLSGDVMPLGHNSPMASRLVDTRSTDEEARVRALVDAQAKAAMLFEAVVAEGLIRSGVSEKQLGLEVYTLAKETLGVTKHWHRHIVRSGPNTLLTFRDNPPDRVLADDQILFLDLGPIFEDWEADFGRTYVLGNDPEKMRLRDDLATIFAEGKRHFHDHPNITGAELYQTVDMLAKSYGWHYGGPTAGHLVGEFPHEGLRGSEIAVRIEPRNNLPMRGHDSRGRVRHWILEVHLVDPLREIGGFYEELLTIG